MKRYTYISALIGSIIFVLCACASRVSSLPPHSSPDQLSYPPLHISLPQAQRVVMENGIILYSLEDHEIPLINISVVVKIGSAHDPIGKEGLAELTGDVLRTGGTRFLSGNTVDETLEFFAGTLSISVNRDYASVNLSILKKDLDKGLNILSEILQHPAFEEEKCKLAKALKIAELRRINDDPQKLAFREFNRIMYQNTPRGRLATISSVEKIKRDDLVKFYKRFFSPKNTMMTLTGDITSNEAISKINQYFGMWNTPLNETLVIPAPGKNKGRIFFISKEMPQSIVIHGYFAPAKPDTDSYAFEILDFIIGSGGFRSRIFHVIRSSLGLAYTAGSFYKARSDHGIFVAYAITGSETTSTVLSLIQSIMGNLKNSRISQNELDWSKNAINNSFIFSFLSADQIAQHQMMNEYNKLPEDYLLTFRENIQKVHADHVMSVANRYLSIDEANILVVGNEKVYDSLKSKFGDIQKIGDSL